MSFFRPDRRRREHDPYVTYKMIIFVTGGALGLVGIAIDREWLVFVGIAVLLAGVLLRFVAQRRQQD